jgi:hypothetical protein
MIHDYMFSLVFLEKQLNHRILALINMGDIIDIRGIGDIGDIG